MRIGIDGGGTKTKGVLYKNHEIVDEYIGEMGNPIVKLRTCSIKCSTSY